MVETNREDGKDRLFCWQLSVSILGTVDRESILHHLATVLQHRRTYMPCNLRKSPREIHEKDCWIMFKTKKAVFLQVADDARTGSYLTGTLTLCSDLLWEGNAFTNKE